MTYTRTQPASKPPRGATPGVGETMGQYGGVFTTYQTGTLTTSTGIGEYSVVLGVPWSLTGVSLAIKTTADQDVIASAYKQGSAVYSAANRPRITSGEVRSGLADTFASTGVQDFSSTQAFSIKLDQVGTSTATGTYMAAVVHYQARTETGIEALSGNIAGVVTVAGALDDNYLYGQSDGLGGIVGALKDTYLYGNSTGTGEATGTM